MEEVGGHDSYGVGGPEFEAWVILFDVEHEGGAVPLRWSAVIVAVMNFSSFEGFGIARVARWEGYPGGWHGGRCAELLVQRSSLGCRRHGQNRFLAAILVLLLVPLNVHVVGVIDCEVADVIISEASFAMDEDEVVPGEGT